MDLTVVLSRVEHPGNLGAAARLLMNFGVERLALVDPRCDPADPEATARAKRAADLLYHAKVGGAELLDGFDLVVGTTGKLGDDYNLPRTPLLPWQLAEKLAGRDGTVALLFGCESDGLTNDDLARCDFVVSIPTGEEYPSINLSHAVAIMLYELQARKYGSAIAERFPLVKPAEKAQLKKMVDDVLAKHDFTVEERLETQRVLWKRLIGKSMLTQREAMALMGFFRQLQK